MKFEGPIYIILFFSGFFPLNVTPVWEGSFECSVYSSAKDLSESKNVPACLISLQTCEEVSLLNLSRELKCYHLVPLNLLICFSLEDQHMEWKPAGQPEHASLNQCQLIVANRCSGHPQQVVEIRFLCNVIDAGALIGPCSHVTSCCCLIC